MFDETSIKCNNVRFIMATQYGTSGADNIKASASGDTIVGYEGNDSLYGSDSADLIFGNQGEDVLVGYGGNDVLVAGQGNDLVLGNQGDDLLYLNEGSDTGYGGMGNDTIIGGKGDDLLFGGEGNDLLYGNEGSNTIDGGDGIDTVAFNGNRADFAVTQNADGSFDLVNTNASNTTEGSDHVTNVEIFQFLDGTYGAQALVPTVVTTPGPTTYVPTPTDAKFNNADGQIGPNGLKPDGTQPAGTGNQSQPFHVTELHGGGVNDLQEGVDAHIRQASAPHTYNKGTLQADGSVNYQAYGGPQISNGGNYSQSDSPANAGTVFDIFGSADASNLITGGKTWNDYDANLQVKLTLNDGTVANETLVLSHADATGNYTPFAATGGYAGGLDDAAPNDPKTFNDSLNLKFFDTNALLAGTQAPDFTKLPGGSIDLTLNVLEKGTANVLLSNVNHVDFFAANSPQIAFA
jgi:hypothetical protein